VTLPNAEILKLFAAWCQT